MNGEMKTNCRTVDETKSLSCVFFIFFLKPISYVAKMLAAKKSAEKVFKAKILDVVEMILSR